MNGKNDPHDFACRAGYGYDRRNRARVDIGVEMQSYAPRQHKDQQSLLTDETQDQPHWKRRYLTTQLSVLCDVDILAHYWTVSRTGVWRYTKRCFEPTTEQTTPHRRTTPYCWRTDAKPRDQRRVSLRCQQLCALAVLLRSVVRAFRHLRTTMKKSHA